MSQVRDQITQSDTHGIRNYLKQSGSAPFIIASGLASIANLIFHPVVSRAVSVDDYGAIGALLAIFSVMLAPIVALELAIARAVERQRRLGIELASSVVGRLFVQSLGIGLVVATALAVATPWIASSLHINDRTAVYYVAAYVIPVAVGIVPKAYLLGERRYTFVALAVVLGSIVRLCLTIPLATRSGVAGAVAATVLGEAVVALILLPVARRLALGPKSDAGFKVQWSDAAGALVASSGFWMLVAIHNLVARATLPGEASGRYLAISVLSQSAIYVASIVSVVAIPKLAATQYDRIPLRRLFVGLLVGVAMIGLCIGIGFTAFHHAIVSRIFGDAYTASNESQLVLLLSLAGMILAVVYIVMQFHLVRKSRMAAAFPWIGVVLVATSLAIWHGGSVHIAIALLLVSLIVLVGMLQPAFSMQHVVRPIVVGEDKWAENDAELDLTMVVPFFNPGNAVRAQVVRLSEVLSQSRMSYEIIAVSDGSTDGSEALLRELDDDHLRLVRLTKNSGKGEALRVGLAMGKGDYLGFIDADGDIDPIHLDSYLQIVHMYEPDIVLGSKRHPMSEVQYPPLRVLYSWGYHKLVHLLFRLRIRDTQTGLKLIRRDVLIRSLPRMLEKRFAFDLELLVVARHSGYERFFEAPIRVDHQFTSTVSWRTTIGMLLDTLAIWYRLHLVRHYDEPTRVDHVDVIEHDVKDGTVIEQKNMLA